MENIWKILCNFHKCNKYLLTPLVFSDFIQLFFIKAIFCIFASTFKDDLSV